MTVEIVTITDVTRMRSPYVCIAGVRKNNTNIRFDFDAGRIPESWLYQNGMVIIRPFSRITVNCVCPRSTPPHTEDWVITGNSKKQLIMLPENERRKFLDPLLDPAVKNIFGAEIHHEHGFSIQEGQGTRSLGTIKVSRINQVRYEEYESGWNYRISFADAAGDAYSLGVTDLAFHCYLDFLRSKKQLNSQQIGEMVTNCLQSSVVYLRLGLTRSGWEKYPHRHFLQVNGVYTFPDYLKGSCFADFLNQD
jgi:hypothetical protein